jgi:hypothetical protein
VHDYFQILGVAPDAGARHIRAACARHATRPHADLLEAERRVTSGAAGQAAAGAPVRELADVAVDFPDLSAVIDRMQSAFFRSPR